MLAENIKSWFEEYEEKGRREEKALGLQRAEALTRQKAVALLQCLLAKCFIAIPSDISIRIAAAPVEQIEAWFDLAIDAPQLSDVFGEN